MNTAPELDLLTKREVAELLKVSEVTIARWLKQGRLPAYRVGPRAVRVRRADVERLMAPLDGVGRPPSPGAGDDWKAQALRPLTEEEKAYGLRWLEEAIKLGNEISARRGGKSFDVPIEEIIRQEREKRTRQIDEAIGHRTRKRRPDAPSAADASRQERE